MKITKNIIATLACISFCIACSASEEAPVIFNKFQIESRVDGVGDVSVSGAAGATCVHEMSVHAFGKNYSFGKDEIAKLCGFNLNGIQISMDGGWSSQGGYTLVIALYTGYSSGILKRKFITLNSKFEMEIEDSP